jgi:hypothetical protein
MRASAINKVLIVAVLLAPAVLSGQDFNPRLSLFASSSVVMADRDFTANGSQYLSEFITGAKTGVRGTVDLTNHWSLDTTYMFGTNNLRITEMTSSPAERSFGVRQHHVTANLLRFINGTKSRARFFVDGGVGLSRFSPTELAKIAAASRFVDQPATLNSDNKLNFNFGGGVEGKFTEHLGMRLYVRDHMADIPRFGVPQTSQGSGSDFFPVSGLTHNIEASVGTVFFF